MEFNLVERGWIAVTRDQYEALSTDKIACELISDGIIALAHSRRAPFELRAGPYVGSAVLHRGARIRIEETVPGSLRELLRHAEGWDVSRSIRGGTADSESPVLFDAAATFVERLTRYLTFGRLRKYVHEMRPTTSPRGRIALRETIAFAARGRVGSVIVHRPILTADVEENRVLGAALIIAESVLRDLHGDGRHLETAVRFGIFFEDVSNFGSVESRGALESIVARLTSSARPNSELHAALEAARPLLLYLGHDIGGLESSVAMRFFNLSTLFEGAVRRSLSSAFGNRGTVTVGRAFNARLFSETVFYVADPDIVLSWDEVPTTVCDVKYKSWGRYPDHGDVYQILAHAEALGVHRAVLIYPGGWPLTRVGVSRSGVELWRCGLEISNLGPSAANLVSSLEDG